MASAPTEASPEEAAPEQESGPEKVAVPCKVDAVTWRKLKFLSLKRSMAAGRNITLSATAGELLDKASEQLDDPPADLVG